MGSNKSLTFHDFFVAATTALPYPYQTELAASAWPDLISVPTGLGKTAAVVLAWLWKRAHHDPDTPTRLVYCLPMRVLVEQTRDETLKWIKNLVAADFLSQEKVPMPYILMGGEIDNDWDIYPERDTILIGTQDQLLSRALNRGYAMSRYRWPMHFGLLNNDCLWVMDEVQLMGSGVATTAQLQAFRYRFKTTFPVRSIWMSATQQKGWLRTIDFLPFSQDLREIQLSNLDTSHPDVSSRLTARKKVSKLDVPWDKYARIAEAVVDGHRPGTLTLVVANMVERARKIYDAITKHKLFKTAGARPDLLLVHSRFRPPDRQTTTQRLLEVCPPAGRICVATQVVEAGLDISAAVLVTDVAPWPSLVQRFGRCNRYGERDDAAILWIPLSRDTTGRIKKTAMAFYTESDLNQAEDLVSILTDASPGTLPHRDLPPPYVHVIRSKDIVELFDTTPDLAGMDIDVSRFIREGDDHDAQVFWRDIPEAGPDSGEPRPAARELCPVPVWELRKSILEKKRNAWSWDSLEGRWAREQPAGILPGKAIMLRRSDGGYAAEFGWSGNAKDVPEAVAPLVGLPEADSDDAETTAQWELISEHTERVAGELSRLSETLNIPPHFRQSLNKAAHWHDAGKAHPVFHQAVCALNPPDPDVFWGKTASMGRLQYMRNGKPTRGFRHELASALAVLQNDLSDLCAYLVAAHHGKVRCSIRSFPHETKPPDPGQLFARGIWSGDLLPRMELGDGEILPETFLDLSYMSFGQGPRGPSWVSRVLELRDSLGVFVLAYLETMLRVADWRGSMAEEGDR